MRFQSCVGILVVAAACGAGDDSWVVRPPGGGGGVGTRVDSAPLDAVDGDAAVGLTGQVCVVSEFRTPDACPDVAAARGVLVRRQGDADGATSDATGRFTLALTDPVVILEVGADAATLIPALVPVRNDGPAVVAPVATEASWLALLAATGTVPATGAGAVVLYVDASDGTRAPGVVVEAPLSAGGAPFYDRDNGTWAAAGGTGPAGVAVLLDLPPGLYRLDGSDPDGAGFALAGVPVADGAVTFVRAQLAP